MSAEFACVLRSGGDFDPSWVLALARGIREHLPGASVTCLTDLRIRMVGVETAPLLHGWPGWWSKVELFRPGLFSGPVVYLDLDTLPVGDLSDLASWSGDLAMLSDFYEPAKLASGVMAWTPSRATADVYRVMATSARQILKRHTSRSDHFYRDRFGSVAARLQRAFPGQIVSLKVHARNEPPDGARLVCGHGKPRLSHPSAGWAHRLWKKRAS